MCHPDVTWTKLLPAVLIVPGGFAVGNTVPTTLPISGAFFTTQDTAADPFSFVGKLREHFRLMTPIPTAHHIRAKHYAHKDLTTCTHVFRRRDAVKPPLAPPYTSPHHVLQRLDTKRFGIEIDGAA